MGAFIVRRLVMAFIVLIIVTLLIFLCLRLLPGDPVLMLIPPGELSLYTNEELDLIRHEYGLDRSLPTQYFSWIGDLLHGDMGDSIYSEQPIVDEIIRRIPITLHVGLIAFVVGLVVGIPAGVVCAVRRNSWMDTLVTSIANVSITVPTFWLGLLLIYLFGLYLGWLPIMGYTSPLEDFVLSTKQLVMPVSCLALGHIAGMARMARSSMLEVMRQDYIRTAQSKGLKERVIIFKHALKNGLIPLVTMAGMGFSHVIGGSVVIERVFNIPGMGRLLITSVENQDYPYVQGITLILAIVTLLSNLLVDISYGWLDPRIRYS